MQGDHRVDRLKLHELHVLLAQAQAGSMAKAAAQLGISEPAVSRAIADMEHTLGVSLFDRSSRGVEPTPYGCALIKRGVAVFDELRLGIREIEFIKDPTIGEVHIGATSTIAEVGIIAAVIDHISQKYPSRIELADLVNEHWTLPEPGHPVTSIVAQAFRAIECETPRVTATAAPGRIRDTLLATGRFLTVTQESALHFGTTLSPLK